MFPHQQREDIFTHFNVCSLVLVLSCLDKVSHTNPTYTYAQNIKTYKHIKTQLYRQIQFTSYRQVIKAIFKEEGLGGFWKGVSASYVGCFEGAIQWMAYEQFKTMLQTRADAELVANSTRGAGKFEFERSKKGRGGGDLGVHYTGVLVYWCSVSCFMWGGALDC